MVRFRTFTLTAAALLGASLALAGLGLADTTPPGAQALEAPDGGSAPVIASTSLSYLFQLNGF